MSRTRLHRLAALGSVAVLGLTLAGCGGSSGSSGSGGSDALTAKEFRSQANKICTTAQKDTDAVGEGLSDNPTEEEFTAAIDKAVARNKQMVDDIAALDEPESLSDDVDAMLASVRTALQKLDDATLDEIGTMEDPFTDANTKAKALGLDACAES